MQKTKIIKDLVHGYIEIDNYVAEIVDNRSFQRLKNISQLTCHHLFPSANHTRFEHSLGVMHLSQRFFGKIRVLLMEKLGNNIEQLNFLEFHLKYASLLHDVGHGPFSHLGESFYDKDEIVKNIKETYPRISDNIFICGSKHELMSCYVINRNFEESLYKIASKLGVGLDMEFMFRIITGDNYSDHKEYWARNLMIGILNSSTVDTDKIDYLMRDNLMIGMVAPNVQIERLIKSLYIDSEDSLTFLPVGVSGLLSIIDCRDLLYLWVYNHHTVVYTDFLYQDMIQHLINLGKESPKYINGINVKDYFSCSAIADKYISDDDIRVLLNKEYTSSVSGYSKKVLPQILERKFLKPLWKTIHEFETYLTDKFDRKEIERIIEDVPFEDEKTNYRNKISKMIQKKCNLNEGEVFIIKRSNKFYSMSKTANFYVYYKGKGNTGLSDIIPQRNFQESYKDVAFYVFCKEQRQEEVKEALTDILKYSRYK